MKTATSRFKKPQKHTFAGEAEGVPLVEWLNSENSDDTRAEIALALVLSREVQEACQQSGAKTRAELADAILARRDIIDKQQTVNALFENYQHRPVFRPGIDSYSFGWLPTWQDSDESVRRRHEKIYGPETAILDIMRLSEKGLLFSVKQCVCGKWIFAKFPQEKHCSGKCRMAAHRANPKYPEQRREWKKSNREAHEILDTGGSKYQSSRGRRVR